MAAYAALVSLMHILNRVQNPHPRHIFLKEIQSSILFDQVSFLLDFVEVYSQKRSKETKLLESQIIDATYAAEDIIESYIVDQILGKSAGKKDRGYASFCKDLTKIERKMNLIKKEVMKIKLADDDDKYFNENNSHSRIEASGTSSIAKPLGGKKNSTMVVHIMNLSKKVVQKMNLIKKEVMKIKLVDDDKQHFNEKNSHSRIEAAAGGKKDNTMVGFDEDLKKLVEVLSTYRSDRLIIPIVGMGGIGKTTLARNTYDYPVIMNNFVIRAWVTISLEYSVRELILGLLYDIRVFLVDHENQENNQNLASFTDRMNEKSDEQLGEQLHKCLFGRKYLIVLDDIWSSSAWDVINKFLPDNNNGSRIMMTTRLSTLALSLGSSLNTTYEMKFLDDDKSWNLLSEKVFGQQVCPPKLEKYGRIIAKNCGGLPLAIVVIGGLLKVSNKTEEYWENVAENVINSIANAENYENCLKILSLSYNQMPIHLKPLFLYMATFPEDSEIRVSRLIKLWVSEGFLKPTINDKTLEEVAVEYLKDLINRNLIMVTKRGPTGNIKSCLIHDLLRDLCLREAQNERFICVTKMYDLDSIPQSIKVERRLCVHRGTREEEYRPQVLDALQSMSLARSLVCNFKRISPWVVFSFSLLRVFDVVDSYSFEDIQRVVNSRYLAFSVEYWKSPGFFSSISRLWNLETLIVGGANWKYEVVLPSEIWELPHLRHLVFSEGVYLAEPAVDGENDASCVLNNLQTLFVIKDFRCSEKVLCKIPNLKKLKVSYKIEESEEATYCLNNLVHFHKLETLSCSFYFPYYSLKTLSNFPPNLKKLVLDGCRIPWENMSIVGSLPNLEVFKILDDAFVGREWNSAEGEFQCLKFLLINAGDLKIWRAESSNFPTLEHLVIVKCSFMEEIPWGIGEISSLQSIELRNCYISVIAHAKDMLEEQQMQGNDDLQIHVHPTLAQTRWYPKLQSLAIHNFHVHTNTN